MQVAGLVLEVYRGFTKKGQRPYVDFLLDDGSDRLKVSLGGANYEQYEKLIGEEAVLFIKGHCRFNSYFNRWQIHGQEIINIEQSQCSLIKSVIISLRHSELVGPLADYPLVLRNLLVPAPAGQGVKISLDIIADDIKQRGRINLRHGYQISQEQLEELKKLFGDGNVALFYEE